MKHDQSRLTTRQAQSPRPHDVQIECQDWAVTPATGNRPQDFQGQAEFQLVQRLYLSQPQAQVKITGFAGVDHGVGVTRLTARVGLTLSHLIQGNICVVDANLRSPGLADFFDLPNLAGFGDFLTTSRPTSELVQRIGSSNLYVMSEGATISNPTLALRPIPELYTRLLELQSMFEYVLMDLPPINRYPDALLLGPATDGVTVVLQANKSRRAAAVAAVKMLETSNTKIFGSVLNERTYPIPDAIYDRF